MIYAGNQKCPVTFSARTSVSVYGMLWWRRNTW